MVRSGPVHILVDYRPALRQRTGVGEYVHRLVEAMLPQLHRDERLTLFSSSWKDRLIDAPAGAGRLDVKIPVTLLNLAWHRLGWPPVERLGARPDITWSLHPLLMPSRAGAQAVTIHDLYFLDHPGDTRAEIRRDYPALAARHAARADVIVVNSEYTREQAVARLGVQAERVVVCYPGAPSLAQGAERPARGPILHLGTVEPRKNIGVLLEAHRILSATRPGLPTLVLAGKVVGPVAGPHGPEGERARFLGYVEEDVKRRLLHEASMLVIPSAEEGFGMPAVEAMACGVPVIAANRGALPEVVGDAGLLFDPASPEALAAAIGRLLDDDELRRELQSRGAARAARFRWDDSASRLLAAFRAVHTRRRRAA